MAHSPFFPLFHILNSIKSLLDLFTFRQAHQIQRKQVLYGRRRQLSVQLVYHTV